MDYRSCVLCFAFLLAVIRCTETTVCKKDLDCGAGECCYIKPEFEVVSRRRQAILLPVQHTHHDTGVCEEYKLEHAPCGPLETANGHCGCKSGYSCQFVPAEIVQPLVVSKKRSIFVPGPGSFQCEVTR